MTSDEQPLKNLEVIPVGYVTKMAMDIEEGDYVKLIGKILYVGLGEDTMFVDRRSGQEYLCSTIELEVASVIPDTFQYFLLPMDEEVRILSYAAVHGSKRKTTTSHVDKIIHIM